MGTGVLRAYQYRRRGASSTAYCSAARQLQHLQVARAEGNDLTQIPGLRRPRRERTNPVLCAMLMLLHCCIYANAQ